MPSQRNKTIINDTQSLHKIHTASAAFYCQKSLDCTRYTYKHGN